MCPNVCSALRCPRPFPLVFIFIIPGFLLSGLALTFAQTHEVVINEIAWAGTAASSTDEWIELYNTTDSSIDLSGWALSSADDGLSVSLSGSIGPHGYFLLERTDENTILDLVADQLYTGGLGNTGESLQLRDGSANLIDAVDCSGGWFAGSSSPRASMERRHPTLDGSKAESWTTNDGLTVNGHDANGDPLLGTPDAENSGYDLSLSVSLINFFAVRSQNAVLLKWSTGSETGNMGFYVHRAESEEGPYECICPEMITGAGSTSAGKEYSYLDHSAMRASTWYKLESVDSRGQSKWHGPVLVHMAHVDSPFDSRLVGNYPNPFNPSTTILYEINSTNAERGASLKIYNLLGREVLTLVDNQHQPGRYSVRWNGRDGIGREVSSGLYWYRLICENALIDAKMMTKIE